MNKDIHYISRTYTGVLEQLRTGCKKTLTGKTTDLEINPHNRETIQRFLTDCELGKTILKGTKKEVGKGRCLRLFGLLKNLDGWFNHKPFEDVTQQEMEDFILKLKRGEIQHFGKPYTPETQKTIKRAIMKFYKWLLGNGEKYPKLVSWIDCCCKIPEIDPPKFKEIEAKLNDPKTDLKLEEKALMSCLTDGGLRIGELLNVRIADVKLPDDENKNWHIRVTESKTYSRTVDIYFLWEHLKNYYDTRKESDGFLFNRGYHNIQDMLHRISKKMNLKQNLHAHLLRHTSATFYSNYLTHAQLCHRYGWSLATQVIRRYVSLNGIQTPEAIAKLQDKRLDITQEKTSELKKSNEELNLQLQRMAEQMKLMQDRMTSIELNKCLEAEQQQKTIFVPTPQGLEAYSTSGCQLPLGHFKPIQQIRMEVSK